MAEHTIHLPEDIYQRLQERAQRLQTTPEAVLSQLAHECLGLTDEPASELPFTDEPPTTAQALAAVQRLTRLFADVTIPHFDQMINDPMLALENICWLDTNHG